MLALCFADDAVVHDEDRDHRGLDAIKSWKRDRHKVPVHYRASHVSVDGDIVRLRARLTGDSREPVELDYLFTLANDKITHWRFSDDGKVPFSMDANEFKGKRVLVTGGTKGMEKRSSAG